MIDDRMFDFKNFYEKIANQLPNNCVVVEVGNADGASGLYLAQRLFDLQKQFKMYFVDNMGYGGYNQMNTIWRNVYEAGMADFIDIVPKDSIEASKGFNGNSLDMVFIDSSHTYEDTRQEIVHWYTKVKDGGILAGHDATSEENEGVGRAVKELLPEIIKRPDIDEPDHKQEFFPHHFLTIHKTEKGYGVWEVEKNFYWQPKLPLDLINDSYISYLNLDIREDRKEHIEKELARIGIAAVRTRGKLPNEYDLTEHRFNIMASRTAGAIGCWMGMREMMVEAIKQDKHCFIFEDDVILASDYIERLNYMEKFFETHDWDIWFGGALFHCSPPHWHNGSGFMLEGSNLGRDAELTDDPRVIRTWGCFSTHNWLIKRESVQKVMDLLDSVMHRSIGIDHACIILQPQLKCYTFVGGSASQLDNESNIGTGWTIYSNFARLNGTIENSKYWFTDRIEDFNPEIFDWQEIANK